MQVKKFEAKTMKEALQLVKQELGPEAIILSAKDNKRSFGLAGRGSVEITAAISEKSLQKKKYVDKHLPEDAREKFRNQSARKQKEFIDDSVSKFHERSAHGMSVAANARLAAMSGGTGAVSKRPMTTQRYIDIGEEEQAQQAAAPVKGRRVDDLLKEFAKNGNSIFQEINERPSMKSPESTALPVAHEEVISLRKEVESLRELLGQFTRDKSATRHPGAEYGLPFEFSASFEKLQNAGVDTKYIVEILEKANEALTPMEKKKPSLADAWIARYLLSHTSVTGSWLRGIQTHLFMGPSGHGKTSSLVKTASHLVLNEKKKVAVLSTDTHKVGAADQLRIYCQILNLPFETVKHSVEFPKMLQKYASYDAILVDYPGFALKDIQEIDQIRALMPSREIPKQTHLVLSCANKDLDAYESCHRYQVTHFDDILVSKVDESYVHGFLYNIQRKTEKALYAFGLGPKIPEDIELATRERVLDLIYKITKHSK